jgi:hypothetical protein
MGQLDSNVQSPTARYSRGFGNRRMMRRASRRGAEDAGAFLARPEDAEGGFVVVVVVDEDDDDAPRAALRPG